VLECILKIKEHVVFVFIQVIANVLQGMAHLTISAIYKVLLMDLYYLINYSHMLTMIRLKLQLLFSQPTLYIKQTLHNIAIK